ncbi:hypothetical protein ACQP1O_31870 [Nocardia sp. CA-151230]|uniref:hypothetical protein n=1 Tax=Nocardia sp. CA-151230 TaxID=3239982 RepID=UPI003D8E872D
MGDQLLAYTALAAHRLALGEPAVHVEIAEAGHPRNLLFDGWLPLDFENSPAETAASRLSYEIRMRRSPGEIGSVHATVDCVGEVSGDGGEILQQESFRLGTSAYEDYVTTYLVTFSDAWMAYDLRGCPQPHAHAANQPRLAAVLRDLSELLDSETDPEDPTYFGTPTESGIDNFFEPDGSPSDVWSRFEENYSPFRSWDQNK